MDENKYDHKIENVKIKGKKYLAMVLSQWIKENNTNNDLKYIVNQSSLSGRMPAIKNIKTKVYDYYQKAFKLGSYNANLKAQTEVKNYFSGGIAELGSSSIALKPLQSSSVLDKPVKTLRVSLNFLKKSVLLPALLAAQTTFASMEDYKPFLDTATTEMNQIVSVVASQTSTKEEKETAWGYVCRNPNMYYVDTLSKIYLNYPIADQADGYYIYAMSSFRVQQSAKVIDVFETNLKMYDINSSGRASILMEMFLWADSMYTNSIYFDRNRVINLLLEDFKNTTEPVVAYQAAVGLGRVVWNTDTELITQISALMNSNDIGVGQEIGQDLWTRYTYPGIQANDPKTLYKNELPETANHDTLLKAAEDSAKEYFAEIRRLAIYNLAIEGVWTKKQDTAAVELLEKINPALTGGAVPMQDEAILEEITRVYPIIKSRLQESVSIRAKRIFSAKQRVGTIKPGYYLNGRRVDGRLVTDK